MPREFEQIRCQRCRAPNPFGQELCDQCGTRLMLVVEPSSLRFEEETMAGAESGGLLAERVSVLENNLTRFAEKLERTLDLMLKQVQSAHVDHMLLDTLITVLTEARIVDGATLARRWREVREREGFGKGGAARASDARERIVAAFEGDDTARAVFVHSVEDGFKHLAASETAKGVKSLERAAAHAHGNLPLLAFLGEHFFRAGKTGLALRYLQAALAAAGGGDLRLRLLAGIALADQGGDVEGARELLAGVAAAEGGPSFAAHYSLGRLAAAGGAWAEAAAQFRKALAARACAESHFVFALAQYQLGRLRLALRHAGKALELGESYEPAFRLLGLVQKRLGDTVASRAALRRAAALRRVNSAPPRAGLRAGRASEELLLHDFFGASRETGKGVLTGGDLRLAGLLRADALAYEPPAR
ncbi:MAG: hypothetical protein LC800_07575 [Acidobacteria bacterium]|nr:hypothetical protein [Acidobacteriota bacterium]